MFHLDFRISPSYFETIKKKKRYSISLNDIPRKLYLHSKLKKKSKQIVFNFAHFSFVFIFLVIINN